MITTTGLLGVALLPLLAAVPPDAAAPAPDAAVAGRMPVAIAQPLVTMPAQRDRNPMLPESGLLVLVGSALFGLATVVRRTTT